MAILNFIVVWAVLSKVHGNLLASKLQWDMQSLCLLKHILTYYFGIKLVSMHIWLARSCNTSCLPRAGIAVHFLAHKKGQALFRLRFYDRLQRLLGCFLQE